MQENLLAQGVELMLVGMGTVFVFLTALVIATSLMSAVVARRQASEPPSSPAIGAGPTEEEVAAITVAIDQYRRR